MPGLAALPIREQAVTLQMLRGHWIADCKRIGIGEADAERVVDTAILSLGQAVWRDMQREVVVCDSDDS